MNTLAIAAAAVALWSGSGRSVRAQCFELPQLLSISTARMSVVNPERVPLLPAAEWLLQRAATPTQETVWTSVKINSIGIAESQVLLRPLPGQTNPDVLLKTSQAACLRQVRATLKGQGIKPVPVTCPNCEAQRYQGTDYVATLYSGLKGDYPYLLVVHPLTAAVAAPSVSR